MRTNESKGKANIVKLQIEKGLIKSKQSTHGLEIEKKTEIIAYFEQFEQGILAGASLAAELGTDFGNELKRGLGH